MNPTPPPRSPRHLRSFVGAGAACAALTLVAGSAGAQPKTYTASWASVNTHPPAPEWFQDAKFGIYFHWGVYSVPAFGSEWYPRNMYDKAGDTGHVYSHHVSTYGDPFSNWPYNDFIDGATAKNGPFTQFAPKLVSAGGNWDPDAWARLFVNAGARFAGPSMEHHDGFSMWDSKANPWNSVAHGPKLNLAALHVNAFRKAGLKIVAALHHAYHFNGYYEWAPPQSDPNLKILFGQQGAAAENALWLAKLKEVIDEFQPDIVWQDFDLNRVDPNALLTFLSYYYNAAEAWGKEVVATYKDGANNQGEVFDFERGGPATIMTPYWLTDDAVGTSSWCYTAGMRYYTPKAVLDAFIDRVSKGGNLLLNISPMADGTIPQAQQDILNFMGSFLKPFGTAIYGTRAWTVFGEGPTKMGGGAFTNPREGTPKDVRYTRSKDGSTLYAIFMGWPGGGPPVTLASVTTAAFAVGRGKVFLFGANGGPAIPLSFTQDASGLHVTLPSAAPYTSSDYALAISNTGTPPGPTPWIEPGDAGAGGLAGDSGTPPVDDSGPGSGSDGASVPVEASDDGAAASGASSSSGGTSGSSEGSAASSSGAASDVSDAAATSTGSGGSPAAPTGGQPSEDGGISGGGAGERSGCNCALAGPGREPIENSSLLGFVAAGLVAGRRRASRVRR